MQQLPLSAIIFGDVDMAVVSGFMNYHAPLGVQQQPV
jgi:hypothetical protein